MSTRLHAKYPLCSSILIKLKFSRQIFEESSNTKFHQNPSGGSRVVPRGQPANQTDMTKVIVVLRNSANAPQNKTCLYLNIHYNNLQTLRTRKSRQYAPRCSQSHNAGTLRHFTEHGSNHLTSAENSNPKLVTSSSSIGIG
jgi:hypothetical protein